MSNDIPGIPFDPYDDSLPISARMGMQRLGAEVPPQPFDPENRLMPELPDPPPPTPINKRRLGKRPKGESATPQLTPFQAAQQSNLDTPSESRRNYRELASTGLEGLGLLALAAGFWLLYPWLGLIVTGLCLVALGVATSDRFTWPRD